MYILCLVWNERIIEELVVVANQHSCVYGSLVMSQIRKVKWKSWIKLDRVKSQKKGCLKKYTYQ